MRVLFATWAWPSHLYAMVPLAWACRSAGHDVRVASQPSLLDVIERTGLTGVPVGYDVDAVAMVRSYVLPSESVPPPAEAAQRTGKGPRALQMFLAHAQSMTPDLVDFARDWEPDVLVSEPTAWAGPIAAAATGVPAVRHLYGTDLMHRAKDVVPQVTEPITTGLGLDPVDAMGDLTIDPWPEALQTPASYRRLPVRYVPFNGTGSRATGWTQPSRPRVCVTWGHTIAQLGPQLFFAGDVARALGSLDVEVVVAVSSEQVAVTGDLPENARLVVDVPLDLVLPSCDLLVAHGGAGTTLTGLAHGLAQILVPQLPDHAGHAGQVLKAGAAEVLARDEATPERLRAVVRAALDDRAMHESTRTLQQELLDQPPPAALVDALQELVERGA